MYELRYCLFVTQAVQPSEADEDMDHTAGTSGGGSKRSRRKPAYAGGLVLEPKKGSRNVHAEETLACVCNGQMVLWGNRMVRTIPHLYLVIVGILKTNSHIDICEI